MAFQAVPSIEVLASSLCNNTPKPSPIGMRMRAAYFLRYHYETIDKRKSTDDSTTTPTTSTEAEEIKGNVIDILCQCLCDKTQGSLIRHEIGFVLGQLRDTRSCPVLEKILDTPSDCIIARHECAEALGAIGSTRSIPYLEKYTTTSPTNPIEISETCQIALGYLQWKERGSKEEEYVVSCLCMEEKSPYLSVDPAPPHVDPKYINLSNHELGQFLLSSDTTLFDRYRVLFTLRNRGNISSVQELNNVLITDTSSALLRHEVAYVLGQIQNPCSKDALITCLKNQEEHRMVRHEAAEAIGAIMEYETDEVRRNACRLILEEYMEDEELVVSESCMVALDAVDYWSTSN